MIKYLFIYLAEGEPLSPGLARGVGSLEEALDPQPMTANILLFLTLFYKNILVFTEYTELLCCIYSR